MSELDKALKRRTELLAKCRAVDIAAGALHERGNALDTATRDGFRALDELRAVEHLIHRLREKQAKEGK